jgi:hypothetical protein
MEQSDIFGPRLAGRRVKAKSNYNASYWRSIKLFKDFKKNFCSCGVCCYKWARNFNTLFFNRPIMEGQLRKNIASLWCLVRLWGIAALLSLLNQVNIGLAVASEIEPSLRGLAQLRKSALCDQVSDPVIFVRWNVITEISISSKRLAFNHSPKLAPDKRLPCAQVII